MFKWRVKRAKRVRMHLIDPHDGMQLPSVEGILIAKRRRDREYAIALPSLITTVEGNAAELDSRLAVIPFDRVAFYEELR
jgi:hypothetical protein